MEQIPPHEPKERCEEWVKNPDIVGCCKPYEIVERNNGFWVQSCEYK
jgi:hypothetical protein